MERFPLNPNRWVEPLSMFGCRLGRSTPPSERQFKCHVRLCVPRRLVRALRCFLHSQTHFENIRTEHLLRNVVRSHPTCVPAASTKAGHKSDVCRSNYDFVFLREDNLGTVPEYVLHIIPKRQEKGLLLGDIWVDAKTPQIRQIV